MANYRKTFAKADRDIIYAALLPNKTAHFA